MTEQPQTARSLMMNSMEQGRIERRDAMVARSVAAEALEKHFKPELIEDLRDVQQAIIRAAEEAAYAAIQKERELHLGEMKMLEAWSTARWAEQVMKMPAPIFVAKP